MNVLVDELVPRLARDLAGFVLLRRLSIAAEAVVDNVTTLFSDLQIELLWDLRCWGLCDNPKPSFWFEPADDATRRRRYNLHTRLGPIDALRELQSFRDFAPKAGGSLSANLVSFLLMCLESRIYESERNADRYDDDDQDMAP